MAPDLPFYYWTLNERFRDDDDDDHDSFDVRPEIPDDQDPSSHPLRLHRLRINRREDASILCAGRAFLPARNQRIYHPLAQLPDPGIHSLCVTNNSKKVPSPFVARPSHDILS